MAISDEDYKHVVALNDEQRELEGKLREALALAKRYEKRIAALERVRHVFIAVTNAADSPWRSPSD